MYLLLCKKAALNLKIIIHAGIKHFVINLIVSLVTCHQLIVISKCTTVVFFYKNGTHKILIINFSGMCQDATLIINIARFESSRCLLFFSSTRLLQR